jgi:hypothetical protein
MTKDALQKETLRLLRAALLASNRRGLRELSAEIRATIRHLRTTHCCRLNGFSRPRRLTLSRRKGYRLPDKTVVVSRPTQWGNPFRVGVGGLPSKVVDRFERWMMTTVDGRRLAERARAELAGKHLACWCKPGYPCHADVLLRIANEGSVLIGLVKGLNKACHAIEGKPHWQVVSMAIRRKPKAT